MRKILSLVLVLALVLGSFAFTFAATPSDVVGEDSEDAVNVLMDLGVINGYPDGSFKPAGIVTRGEMAKIVISALGLEDYAAGTSGFSDMAGNWSDKYVAYAVSLGIINGYPDGTFKPNNTVSYDEAAKMLVAALGYTPDSLVGAWPVNWVTKAKVLGILDGIKAGSAGANRGDIAIMTYQTLDQTIGKTDKDGLWTATMIKAGPPAEYDTMLDRLGSALYAPTGAGSEGDAFVLTDTLADEAVANVRDLVGAYVTAYANSDDEIIAIKEVKSVFLTGEFDAAIVTGTTFETDDQDYDLVLPVAPFTPVEFTNGELDAGFAFAAAREYRIAADVSGVKIKDVYSVSEWVLDDDFQFDDGDLEDDNIAGNNFILDDDDEIDMSSFALLGVDSLEDIEEDNVVYVYLGATSGKITKLAVGTETVSGEVTRIKGSEYTIGGKVYEFSTAPGVIGTTPGIDDEIEMTLDYAGDIYDYEVISGEADLYGIVLRTGVASEDVTGLGASDAEIELFMADGTKKTFVVDYDETLAGGGTGIPAAIYNTATNPDAWALGAGDVVEYDLNKDGEIESIEWVADISVPLAKRGDTTLSAAAADMTSKGYYQAFQVATDALIMTYDAAALPSTDEDDYGIAQRANLLGSEIPTNAFYVVDSGKIVFMYIDNDATSSDSVFGLLIDSETNNSDAGYGVDMLIDGVEVFKNSFNALAKTFDWLYYVEYDVDGDVSALTEQTLDPTAITSEFYNSANVGAVGTCSISGRVISLSAGLFDINDGASTIATVTLDEDVVVYEWNATDGVFEKASISDIKGENEVSFFDTEDDGAMIFNIVLIHDGTGNY